MYGKRAKTTKIFFLTSDAASTKIKCHYHVSSTTKKMIRYSIIALSQVWNFRKDHKYTNIWYTNTISKWIKLMHQRSWMYSHKLSWTKFSSVFNNCYWKYISVNYVNFASLGNVFIDLTKKKKNFKITLRFDEGESLVIVRDTLYGEVELLLRIIIRHFLCLIKFWFYNHFLFCKLMTLSNALSMFLNTAKYTHILCNEIWREIKQTFDVL